MTSRRPAPTLATTSAWLCRAWGWAGYSLLLALAGCRNDSAFLCSGDAECEGANGGRCEATRYCSFPDDTCASERRYGDLAGEGLAGECVDELPGTTSTSDDTGPGVDSGATTGPDATTTTTPVADSGSTGCESNECPSALRQLVKVDHAEGAQALTSFPVLVALTPSTTDYEAMADGATDVRFTDLEGNDLPHDIEVFDPTGVSFLWVLIPQIEAGSTDGVAWMTYGTGLAIDVDPSGVWAEYQAVYHLGDTLQDASPSGFDGTNAGSAIIMGAIGDGRDFTASAYVDLGSDRDFVRNAEGVTWSAWVRPDGFGATRQVLFTASTGEALQSRLDVSIEAGGLFSGSARALDSQPTLVTTVGPALTAGRWQHLAVAIDYVTPQVRLYVDGQRVATNGTPAFGATVCDDTPNMTTHLAVDDNTTMFFYGGGLDEVRVVDQARSDEWMRAQHRSMTGTFATVEPPEPAP